VLIVQDLCVQRAAQPVLRGVSLHVAPGELVGLLGRNGSGRSTLAQALVGLLPAQGRVTWCGQPLLGLRPFEVARCGVGYVPERRDVFGNLTVEQNLLLGQRPGAPSGPWTPERAYTRFAGLRARRHTLAGVLSGGEQQWLALARTLMGNPGLLVLDEPTEGLSPQAVQQVAQVLAELRQHGTAVLLMEQKLAIALSLCDRLLVMGQGQVVFDGTPQQLQAQPQVAQDWLAV
jgi:branched-chain amino acid transport system ATP-binding protein